MENKIEHDMAHEHHHEHHHDEDSPKERIVKIAAATLLLIGAVLVE